MVQDLFAERIRRASALMEKNGCDALIVTSTPNVFYFTGQWIDPHERLLAVLIRLGQEPVIFAPALHVSDFASTDRECVFLKDGEDAIGILAGYLADTGTVSIDNTWQSANLLALMGKKPGLRYVTSDQVLVPLRMIKDRQEMDSIRQSGIIANRVMERLIPLVQPGVSELELVDELKLLWKQEEITELSFDPCIAAGANGANPHHVPGASVIQHGDLVIIDMGGIWQHYCSDMTRTIGVGEVSQKQQDVYHIVKEAQEAAASAVRPGVRLGDIDLAARRVIADSGYGEQFVHRTGHGLGIEIHEAPYVHHANDLLIEPGMVFSVEPGIYLPGEFGVRIEDIVMVTDDGCESVNLVTKELVITGSSAK